ncbi:hypothetical protein GCM10011319_45260 [Mameliella alba]|nr:hypothetical protein GCM10011319_45260 [Mameliella alba]
MEIEFADAALPGAGGDIDLGRVAAVFADQHAPVRVEPEIGAALVTGKAVLVRGVLGRGRWRRGVGGGRWGQITHVEKGIKLWRLSASLRGLVPGERENPGCLHLALPDAEASVAAAGKGAFE